jgi:hypothetical protein
MSSSWPVSSADGRRSRRCRVGGSALVEVGLFLLIVVVGVWLGILLLSRSQQRRRCDRFIGDLRAFSAAFQTYARKAGTGLPASPGESALPPGLEQLLQDTNWHQGSPFGGNYEYLAPFPAGPSADGAGRDGRGSGAIALTAFAPSFPLTLSRRDLRYVDGRIDDGLQWLASLPRG